MLPRRLLNARDIALKRFLAEADAAEAKITHKSAWATALVAATHRSRRELRLAISLNNH